MASVDFTASGARRVKSPSERAFGGSGLFACDIEALSGSRHPSLRLVGRLPIWNYAMTIGKGLPLALLLDSYLWISNGWEAKLLENRTRARPVARPRIAKVQDDVSKESLVWPRSRHDRRAGIYVRGC